MTTKQLFPQQIVCDNPTDTERRVYYEVSFRGVAQAHIKYLALKAAFNEGCAIIREQSPALSSGVDDLAHWASMPGGFTCQHMPWRIVIPKGDLYRGFIHALRCAEREGIPSAYESARRYGSWV